MNLAYKIALFCGLTPLILAVIILSGWFITGEEEFLIAGLFNIAGGVMLFVIGICCLIFYEYQHRQNHQVSAWRKLVKPVFILIVNFPAAAGCMYLVFFMMSVSVVTVENQTQNYIPIIHLKINNFEQKSITGVMPNEISKNYFRFKGGSTVEYSFEINGQEKKGNLIAYTTTHQGGYVLLTVTENGVVSVVETGNKF